jgi:uncharacterized protein (TIGR00251 family)
LVIGARSVTTASPNSESEPAGLIVNSVVDSPADPSAVFEVWVVPGASRSEIVGMHGSSLKIRVTSPAEGGKANGEVIKLLEEKSGGQVTLLRGITSRRKVFQVTGVSAELIVRKLGLDR